MIPVAEPNTKKSFTEEFNSGLHYICMNATKHLKNEAFLSNKDLCKALKLPLSQVSYKYKGCKSCTR